MAIAQTELDAMQQQYKDAVEAWIAAIRAEAALASPAQHSEADIDTWEAAAENQEEAGEKALDAKSAYEEALREEFFSI